MSKMQQITSQILQQSILCQPDVSLQSNLSTTSICTPERHPKGEKMRFSRSPSRHGPCLQKICSRATDHLEDEIWQMEVHELQ